MFFRCIFAVQTVIDVHLKVEIIIDDVLIRNGRYYNLVNETIILLTTY